MFKKCLVTFAEVVETHLSIGRFDKTVLGTLTIANMQDFAFPAVLRKRISLIFSELSLLFRGHEFDHRCLQDVSQVVIRLDEVIARIKIAIVLQSHALTACRPEDADGPRHVQPACQRSVEIQNKCLANVSLNPLVEDLDQEMPPLGRTDRPVCNPTFTSP